MYFKNIKKRDQHLQLLENTKTGERSLHEWNQGSRKNKK